MTQFFAEDGTATAATILEVGANVVTQVRTIDLDGYTAVQIGTGDRKESRIAKPQKGAWKDLGMFQVVREFPVDASDITTYSVGQTIGLTTFQPGDTVRVSGISKAKGFQGVVKRHGFHGGRRSHGQKHSEREAGSIGGSGGRAGGRVAKGMRMAGRMGGDRVTVPSVQVLAVDQKNGLMLVRGAVPGRRGTLVEVSA